MASAAAHRTHNQNVQEEVVRELERLGGLTVRTEDVKREGNSFTIPVNTTLREGAKFLNRLADEQEEYTDFMRSYMYRPWDVAYCLSRVLKRTFGAMSHSGTWLSPPTFIEVPSGPGETVQVPQGEFQVPHLPDVTFSVGATRDEEWGHVGVVRANGPKQRAEAINGVFVLIQQELAEASLYKGMAIEYADMPKFIDVAKIDPSKLVYSAEVQAALRAHIDLRLLHPERLAELGVRFRSKILLEGEFGVGKTEVLNRTAKMAQEQGITFILVPKNMNSGEHLMDAMRLASMYSPAVVAFEDVDTIASAHAEVEHVSRVLDTFDGSQSKLNEVQVLITTNYVTSLHAGMMRPGRIDAVIEIKAPDAEGIRRLIELRVDNLSYSIDWDAVVEANSEYHPAFVVEGASLAIRYAFARSLQEQGMDDDGDHFDDAVHTVGYVDQSSLVNTEDLVAAATELRRQFRLHKGAKTHAEPQVLDAAVRNVVSGEVNRVIEERLDERLPQPGLITVISCKSCGEEGGVRIMWHENSIVYMTAECSMDVELPDPQQMIYENGSAVYLDSDQFADEYTWTGDYVDDQYETSSEQNDVRVHRYGCTSCGGSSPKLEDQFQCGDELDALLNQLGRTLKARR